jgi:hypothetical protein
VRTWTYLQPKESLVKRRRHALIVLAVAALAPGCTIQITPAAAPADPSASAPASDAAPAPSDSTPTPAESTPDSQSTFDPTEPGNPGDPVTTDEATSLVQMYFDFVVQSDFYDACMIITPVTEDQSDFDAEVASCSSYLENAFADTATADTTAYAQTCVAEGENGVTVDVVCNDGAYPEDTYTIARDEYGYLYLVPLDATASPSEQA